MSLGSSRMKVSKERVRDLGLHMCLLRRLLLTLSTATHGRKVDRHRFAAAFELF